MSIHVAIIDDGINENLLSTKLKYNIVSNNNLEISERYTYNKALRSATLLVTAKVCELVSNNYDIKIENIKYELIKKSKNYSSDLRYYFTVIDEI